MNPAIAEQIEAAKKSFRMKNADAPECTPARTNAKNDGRGFEKELEQTAGAYLQKRIAKIHKIAPPCRVFWKQEKDGTRRQVVIFLANPFCDLLGTWMARGGRMLVIEAKSTATHRLLFGRDNGLKSEQVAAMKSWALSGAAVALVWKWGDRCCLFTVPMIAQAEARGDKSLVFENGLIVAQGEGYCRWDFLEALARVMP